MNFDAIINAIPSGHNWIDDNSYINDSYFSLKIKCKKCNQGMSFYSYLDPADSFDSSTSFNTSGISLPIINAWVRNGWALDRKNWNPLVPDSCEEIVMKEALE